MDGWMEGGEGREMDRDRERKREEGEEEHMSSSEEPSSYGDSLVRTRRLRIPLGPPQSLPEGWLKAFRAARDGDWAASIVNVHRRTSWMDARQSIRMARDAQL